MANVISLEDCKKTAKNKRGECLSDEYVNCKVKMKWKCEHGHQWEAPYDAIKNKSWCPVCGVKKQKQSCLNRFGVENPAKAKEIKEKTKQTCLEKYGGFTLSSKKIREKVKQTCLSRYGAENPNNSKEIREKIKQTCLERYSGNCPTCSKEIREKAKQTCLDRYGVDNPTKDRTIALKAARSSALTYVKSHWQTNEELVCQGSYEAKVVDYLNKNQINYRWQPETFKLSTGKTYRPDLYLVDTDTWVEIKGYMRPDAKVKWNEFIVLVEKAELWTKDVLKNMGILVK